jgi:NAD(P)-dependent dehydrogenase (short-subunit alcohol dehydrogenase family)
MTDMDGLGYRGKKAVVTGAASGMGEAAARILGDLGADIHAVDLKPPSVQHAAFYQTDLSQPDEVSTTANELREGGPFQFLFSCAGIPPHTLGPLQCMLVNYVGARQLADEILPAIADGGAIGIISSEAGIAWEQHLSANLELLAIADPVAARRWCEERPEAVRDGYTSSKEMLIVWAMHHSVTLGRERGIRINCIAPCPTSTAFMDATIEKIGQDYFDRYPYPLLGRMATPEEQAWPLVLLTSPLNAVVTGTVLYTDQGFAGGALTGALDASTVMPGIGAAKR